MSPQKRQTSLGYERQTLDSKQMEKVEDVLDVLNQDMKLRFIQEKANAAKGELLHDIDYFLDEHDLYVKAIWEIQKVTGNKKDKKVDLTGSRASMNKTIE